MVSGKIASIIDDKGCRWMPLCIVVAATLAVATHAETASPSADDLASFEQKIRPFLANKCYACHGSELQEGGLRLDQPPQRAGASGMTLLPDDASRGSLLNVLENKDEKKHPALEITAQELEDVLHWISRGAPWPPAASGDTLRPSMEKLVAQSKQTHWSFQPVVPPPLPVIDDAAWSQSPIDTFIYAKLASVGLKPSGQAAKRTLLRRAYYDLIGLPPTFEEIERFENDSSPDAFEKVVDELLESPHYGERWGRYWLDIARYSDTRGSSFREDRYFPFSYTYRDYVIRALNDDLPYDQFILHQIAADQLELGSDKRPLAALGFLTLGRTFNGNLHDVIDDRIDVVTRGLQALSVNCARCHDHKFDPVPTTDYYALYGIFRSAQTPSELPLLEPPDTAAPLYQDYERELKKLEAARDDLLRSVHVRLLAHARSQVGSYLQAAYDAMGYTDDEQLEKLAGDRQLLAPLIKSWRDHLKNLAGQHHPIWGPWLEFAALDPAAFLEQAPALSARIAANRDFSRRYNKLVAKRFEGEPPASMGAVCERYGVLFSEIDTEWMELLAAVTQRGSRPGESLEALPLSLPDEAAEQVRLALYASDSPANIPASDVYTMSDSETRSRIAQRRRAIEVHKGTHPGRPNRAMALENTPTPFTPYVFKRGDAGNRGPDVPRRYLTVLAKHAPDSYDGHGRLELARAIASKDNPLTARVLVNRVWMYHFGKPIVGTPSDFGLRGDKPTHPELLDYLAWQFMEDGWSIKKLHRRIMLSRTYQQASDEHELGQSIDVENALLWRQNRRRLDFEAMRDSILYVANNLDRRIGGYPVNITIPPFPNRRTVYAEIDREDLPAMFRIFDFAAPTTHSPNRFNTTVPQQALFMMNSPFVAEQTRLIAGASIPGDPENMSERVRTMYRRLLMRDPLQEEIDLAVEFIQGQDTAEASVPYHEPSDWRYGYGEIDESTGQVTSFTEFTHWADEAYQASATLPDPVLGMAVLNRLGGHPGGPKHAVIRRWTSPVDSTVACVGELYHHSSEGDGIIGYIVSSREGILWRGEVQDGMIPTVMNDANIRAGDTIDLVVSCNENDREDGFRWHPRVYLTSPEAATLPKQDWLTRFDFQGPPPEPPVPLKLWEQYAQVILMSNEFMFVD